MTASTFFSFLLFSTCHLGFGFKSRALPQQNSCISKFSTCGSSNVRDGSRIMICSASRMPVFNEEDEEQLRKIMAGEFWEDDMPDFSDNLPTRERSRVKAAAAITDQPAPAAQTSNSVSEKKVTAPNANWRTATDAAVAQSKANPMLVSKAPVVIKKKKPVPAPSADYLDFSDLDYDDFESAMRYDFNTVLCDLDIILQHIVLIAMFDKWISARIGKKRMEE